MNRPRVRTRPLPYESRLATRPGSTIKLVVLHCTELPDLATAREFGERIHYEESETGNSGHFYIDRDGTIERWVALERTAHHVAGHNERSIGIELVNEGRYPDWFRSDRQEMTERYDPRQIAALTDLLSWLAVELPALEFLAAHGDLDRRTMPAEDDSSVTIRRRIDPGPLFPWERLELGRLRRIDGT